MLTIRKKNKKKSNVIIFVALRLDKQEKKITISHRTAATERKKTSNNDKSVNKVDNTIKSRKQEKKMD